jgi:transcriptional regulator with GAF, ATPase, and Fis domain
MLNANRDVVTRYSDGAGAEGKEQEKAVRVLTQTKALDDGPAAFLSKPFSDGALLDAMRIATSDASAYNEISRSRDRLALENVYLESEIRSELHFEEIVGKSEALRRVLSEIETVAPADSTVLIYGETGTGKELIAHAVHNLSSRKSTAFVKLNCAAIPTGLLESELFGHEKGAFTGAISQRVGRFELAHRGTIFLDEIGEIPLEVQPKLLRVLQEREFERLGSTRTLRSDARLIAATNRDLKAMVDEQKFRTDLYYRLNVFPIRVPALRERKEDIPLLVRHFVQQFSQRNNREINSIPSETMEALVRYHWPGNIRELQNVIERAVIISKSPVVNVAVGELEFQTPREAAPNVTQPEREVRVRSARTVRKERDMMAKIFDAECVRPDWGDFGHHGSVNPRRTYRSEAESPCGSYIDLDELRSLQGNGGRNEFEGIVGSSRALRGVLDQIRTVAPTDSTVVIEGETGTGKELFATAIHAYSRRRNRPFVKLNCAAIPLSLLESELFGHEKGAFTGAVTRKFGRFEAANGGTLFLDEIGDMPLELQAKLLRVLQEQEFERLGSTYTCRVDVRVLAATNQDLAGLVAGKQFRTDLYYRLNVFPIAVPPLRRRVEDIPMLVAHFVYKYATCMSKQISRIAKDAMDALRKYPWPGNIRELQNFIERAVILTRGDVLQIPAPALSVAIRTELVSLAEAERDHILKALEESNWVVGGKFGAAARLGVKRTTLMDKMRRRGLPRPAAQGRKAVELDPRESTENIA